MEKSRWVLGLFLLGFVACDRNTPIVESGGNTNSLPTKAEAQPTEGVALKHGDETIVFKTMLITEEAISGSVVPQLTFFVDEVDCDARQDHEKIRFYAAIASEAGVPAGDYESPNWGFTGKPEFIPSSADDADPRDSWGKVVVTKSDDTTVSGTVHYEAKGLSVSGAFSARKCPPMLGE